MPLEFSFAEVEGVLAALNRIASEKRIAFRARLKHLQRLGFPKGANTGTGKRAVYTLPMLIQMCLAGELTQTGMAPKRVVHTINWSWADQRGAFFVAMMPEHVAAQLSPPATEEDLDLVWVESPEALRDLTAEGDEESAYMFSSLVFPLRELPSKLRSEWRSPSLGEPYRHVIIQLRPLMKEIMGLLVELRPGLTDEEIGQDFEEYLRSEQERLDRLVLDVKGRNSDGDTQA